MWHTRSTQDTGLEVRASFIEHSLAWKLKIAHINTSLSVCVALTQHLAYPARRLMLALLDTLPHFSLYRELFSLLRSAGFG